MPYTDAIGIWQELNFTPLPAGDDWVTFPNDCKAGRLFRFKFETDWEDWDGLKGFRSFGYLRFAYHDDAGGFGLVTPSIRLYPKQEEMLWEMPTLQDLQDNPWTIRKAQLKRIGRRYPWPHGWVSSTGPLNFGAEVPPVLNWSLYAEYLVG